MEPSPQPAQQPAREQPQEQLESPPEAPRSPAAAGDQQPELDLGVVPTGDPAVDAALAELEPLGQLPVDDHPAVFERVHEGLHRALADEPDPAG